MKSNERNVILNQLTKEQRDTLFSVVSISNRSRISNILAKYKGTEEWAFYKYIDHGSINKKVRCMCRRSLRHQFILINKKTKEKRTMGRDHLIQEFNIPLDIAREVLNGIHQINYDLDELLQKFHYGWELPKNIEKYLNKLDIPKGIKMLLDMDLPLLTKHIKYLYSKIDRIKRKKHTLKVQTKEGDYVNIEIKNKVIYNILIGKFDSFTLLEKFQNHIHRFILKRKSTTIEILISHLVTLGMPEDSIYLYDHVVNYLKQKNYLIRENVVYINPKYFMDLNLVLASRGLNQI